MMGKSRFCILSRCVSRTEEDLLSSTFLAVTDKTEKYTYLVKETEVVDSEDDTAANLTIVEDDHCRDKAPNCCMII